MSTLPTDSLVTADILPSLQTMDLDDLRAVWKKQFGPPPALRSTDTLRLMLAWRLQAREAGDLESNLQSQVRGRTRLPTEGLNLGAGTVLKREWQGQTYEVRVQRTNFHWNGQTFDSLSAVARAITGTRWNGPRFFGLRDGT